MGVKKGMIVATCKACGWNGELDNQHKLAGYISKNPPGTGIGFDGEGGKEKKSRQERQSERAAKKKKKEKKEKKEKKAKADDEPGDEAAEKKEKKEKTESDDESAEQSDSDKEVDELKYGDEDVKVIVDDIAALVKSKGAGLNPEDLFEEVRAQQVTKVFGNSLRMFIVTSALFPDASLDAKGVEKRKKYFQKFISNGSMSFAAWIWGVEAYLDANPGACKAYPMTPKAFYDEDLAQEADILKYYNGSQDSPGFEAAKKACKPFIQWLETTSDSDDSDDDDEDSDSD